MKTKVKYAYQITKPGVSKNLGNVVKIFSVHCHCCLHKNVSCILSKITLVFCGVGTACLRYIIFSSVSTSETYLAPSASFSFSSSLSLFLFKCSFSFNFLITVRSRQAKNPEPLSGSKKVS